MVPIEFQITCNMMNIIAHVVTIERSNFRCGDKNSQSIVGQNWGSLVLLQLTSVLSTITKKKTTKINKFCLQLLFLASFFSIDLYAIGSFNITISSRIDAYKYRVISISSWLLSLWNKKRIIVEVQCSTIVSCWSILLVLLLCLNCINN